MGKAFPVITDFEVSQGCLRCRRMLNAKLPRWGVDAIRTPAGARCASRYFCTINPPSEWPINTGVVGRLAATVATSSTYSLSEQVRTGFGDGLFPWPRRLAASAR